MITARLLFIVVTILIAASLITGKGGAIRRLLWFSFGPIPIMIRNLLMSLFGIGYGVLAGGICFLVLFNVTYFSSLDHVSDLVTPKRYEVRAAQSGLPALFAVVSFICGCVASASFRERGPNQSVTKRRGRELLNHQQAEARLKELDEPATPPKKRRGFWQWLIDLDKKQTQAIEAEDAEEVVADTKEGKDTKSTPSILRIFWGFLWLRISEATGHFLISGSIGSGKSVIIRLLAQSILKFIGRGHDIRAFIYDPKAEFIPALMGMGCPATIHILHPFDQRCVSWDMAEDVTSPAGAYQVASSLVPEEKGESQFWAQATRHMLAGVMEAFIRQCPGQWTLRDVLLVMRRPERVKGVLALHPETQHVWELYASEQRTLANLFSTITSKLRPYEIVAALWSRASGKISLREWASGESVLVLGESSRFKTSLDPINRLLFDQMVDLLLDGSETTTRKTFVVLDEAREMGKLEKLHSLLLKGRSKGVSVVLGFQDIAGMREVYGDKVASELTGQINNKTFLRTDSYDTAKWIEDHMGKVEYDVVTTTVSSSSTDGKSTEGTNTAPSVRTEPLVMASQVMGIPKTSPEHGFAALHDVARVGAYYTHIPFNDVIGSLNPPADGIANHDPRPDSDQLLKEWNMEDLKRLNLPASFLPKPVVLDEPDEPVNPPVTLTPSPDRPNADSFWGIGRDN